MSQTNRPIYPLNLLYPRPYSPTRPHKNNKKYQQNVVEKTKQNKTKYGRKNKTKQNMVENLYSTSVMDVLIADSLNNLAACLEVLGAMEQAKPLYEQSLALRKVM